MQINSFQECLLFSWRLKRLSITLSTRLHKHKQPLYWCAGQNHTERSPSEEVCLWGRALELSLHVSLCSHQAFFKFPKLFHSNAGAKISLNFYFSVCVSWVLFSYLQFKHGSVLNLSLNTALYSQHCQNSIDSKL